MMKDKAFTVPCPYNRRAMRQVAAPLALGVYAMHILRSTPLQRTLFSFVLSTAYFHFLVAYDSRRLI